MSSFEIFQAIPADAQEIGALRARNWKEQYAHLTGVTEEWMDEEARRITGETGNNNRAYWIDQSNRPGANNCWLVARTKDGVLAGFLEARRHEENGSQELRSLHVASEERGLGIGQALIDIVHNQWFDHSVETFLDVAGVNKAGQRFYLREPNNYMFTGYTFFHEPIAMLRMMRKNGL